MLRRSLAALAVCFFAVSSLVLNAQNTINLNFAAVNQSQWGTGQAFISNNTFNIPDPLINEKVNIPRFDTDPTGAFLGLVGQALGLPLDGLASVSLAPTANITAGLSASYHLNGGGLDLVYPQKVTLNMPTQIEAGKSFTISASMADASDLGALNFRTSAISQVGGAGYGVLASKLSSDVNTYNAIAGFQTISPHADASVDLQLNVGGDVGVRGCLLFVCHTGDISLGKVDLSQNLLEANTLKGISVLGQPVVQFGQPLDLSGFGSLTVHSPEVTVAGDLKGNGNLFGSTNHDVADFTFDVEQLLPLVGQILHGQVGPFGYRLATLDPTVSLGIYQDLTFDPNLKVDLQFSQPMIYNGTVTKDVSFHLGDSITLTPAIGNLSASTLQVKPTFTLENQFTNTTGLSLSGSLDVTALQLLDPVNVGPGYKDTIDLGTVDFPPLFQDSFSVAIPSITTNALDVSRTNTFGAALTVQPDGFDSQGNPLYSLLINNQVAGTGYLSFSSPDPNRQCVQIADPRLNQFLCDAFFTSTEDIFQNGQDLGKIFCIRCFDNSDDFNNTSAALQSGLGDLFLSDLSTFNTLPTDAEVLASDPILANSNYFQSLSYEQGQVVPYQQVPEPRTLALFGVGLGSLVLRLRRRR